VASFVVLWLSTFDVLVLKKWLVVTGYGGQRLPELPGCFYLRGESTSLGTTQSVSVFLTFMPYAPPGAGTPLPAFSFGPGPSAQVPLPKPMSVEPRILEMLTNIYPIGSKHVLYQQTFGYRVKSFKPLSKPWPSPLPNLTAWAQPQPRWGLALFLASLIAITDYFFLAELWVREKSLWPRTPQQESTKKRFLPRWPYSLSLLLVAGMIFMRLEPPPDDVPTPPMRTLRRWLAGLTIQVKSPAGFRSLTIQEGAIVDLRRGSPSLPYQERFATWDSQYVMPLALKVLEGGSTLSLKGQIEYVQLNDKMALVDFKQVEEVR
jgi:hypothetical protein